MINYLIMDVDGTLTDGKIYMGPESEMMKAFSVKDGYVINFILKPVGIVPIIITARTSSIIQRRCEELGIKEVHQGKIDKLAALKEIVNKDSFKKCAYFGDDILDLKCMIPIKESGGLVGCPADAIQEVKAIADYICVSRAGEGALREFSEWLLQPKLAKDVIEQRIEESLNYIESLEKQGLEKGKYEVNEFFYYLVQEYDTKPKSECVFEAHRKYIDIQWIVEGEEAMEIADISRLQVESPYSYDNDIAILKEIPNLMRLTLKPGVYTVLYPQNAHRGGIALRDSSQVKKIVGKVRIF